MYEIKRISTLKWTTKVLVAGDRKSPAVILLHGGGPGANAEANWSNTMKDLSEHFYVIAPDLLGFGETSLPEPLPAGGLAWIGLRVEQTLALMEALDIKDANLVGNSMGGALALHLLLDAPGRFRKAVLMGSAGGQFGVTPELMRMLSFYQDPRHPRYREIIRSFVYDPTDTSLFPNFEGMVEQRYREAIREDLKRSYETMFNPPLPPLSPSALASIPHEVLLVHGRQDRVVPLEGSLYLLKNLCKAELVIYDRCGHWAQIERWDAMRAEISRFLLS
ncbi:alpha/beta fold hydrolase [Kyrpidia tusciae]|uniref:Alpha/beta hydrolase fold protein n=1 Tax=Kyrpidia tusciae (strain DSM 2912 / NBRC 15312 / T2) TaxID=562970 RepID=D5WVJ4_KYRT2|nr:alpha/beta hydrolase [Kyrpidia tusciae]ADG07537.1 alpha/beta hydrolase fold protein [Kyrpidia tusciae DSM 2912]